MASLSYWNLHRVGLDSVRSIGAAARGVSRDGSRLALVWDRPARPPEVYVVETATGEARPVTES